MYACSVMRILLIHVCSACANTTYTHISSFVISLGHFMLTLSQSINICLRWESAWLICAYLQQTLIEINVNRHRQTLNICHRISHQPRKVWVVLKNIKTPSRFTGTVKIDKHESYIIWYKFSFGSAALWMYTFVKVYILFSVDIGFQWTA